MPDFLLLNYFFIKTTGNKQNVPHPTKALEHICFIFRSASCHLYCSTSCHPCCHCHQVYQQSNYIRSAKAFTQKKTISRLEHIPGINILTAFWSWHLFLRNELHVDRFRNQFIQIYSRTESTQIVDFWYLSKWKDGHIPCKGLVRFEFVNLIVYTIRAVYLNGRLYAWMTNT